MKSRRDAIAAVGCRLWVIGVLLVCALSLSAQTLAQRPSTDFRSTSVMVGTGSAYSSTPTLGANGMVGTPIASSPRHLGQIRKTGEYDDEEEEDEYGGNAGTPGSTVNEGDQLPLGDVLLPLLLLAIGYAVMRKTRTLEH